MKPCALALLFSLILLGQEDVRNTRVLHTDSHLTMPVYKTRAAWEQRRGVLKSQIQTALGLDPMPAKNPLHAQVFGKITTRDCTIEKVLIEAMPGYFVGGNLYRPLTGGKHPAVLNPHGHWQYGRLENQPLYSGPQLGSNLARQGYVVFAWDMVGYNDTLQTPHAFGTPADRLWGFGPAGLQVWNTIRALDFIGSLDDVDPARIGMTGASGGATQTFLTAALDDRVKFLAPVNMVSGIMQGGDFCENAPGLRYETNNVEIAAMAAPRPMMLVSATGDWTKNVPSEELPAIRSIYALYGEADNVANVHLDAPHNYNKQNREFVYRFFGKHILQDPAAGEYVEKNAEVPMLQDMLATSRRPLPGGAVSYAQVAGMWRQRTGITDPQAALSRAIGAVWPGQAVTDDGSVLLWEGTRVPYSFVAGQGSPVLVIGGTKADIPAGRPGMVLDVFQTGRSIRARDRGVKHFAAFNRTDDQARVQDVLTGLAWLGAKYPGTLVELVGVGTAASVQAEFAAAIAPGKVKLKVDLKGFQGTDDDFLQYLDIPGIQVAGGLAAAQKVLSQAGH